MSLEIQKLYFSYPSSHVTLFEDFSLQFNDGWTCVAGSNGCGKSTLLKLIAGLLKPNREAADLQKKTNDLKAALLKKILTRVIMMQNEKLMSQDSVEKTEAPEMQKLILIVRFKEQRQPAIQ